MYSRFGEFDSAEEINELAVNLRKEGDVNSIKVLATENGIEEDIVEIFLEGELLYLCDNVSAAIGKLDIEFADMKAMEIMADWATYIRMACFENEEMAIAVRKKGKSLKGCIAELLKWSFKHQIPIDSGILKAAGVTASRCTLGIPGIVTAKKIITSYYLGK